jgi:hypothetical protein
MSKEEFTGCRAFAVEASAAGTETAAWPQNGFTDRGTLHELTARGRHTGKESGTSCHCIQAGGRHQPANYWGATS